VCKRKKEIMATYFQQRSSHPSIPPSLPQCLLSEKDVVADHLVQRHALHLQLLQINLPTVDRKKKKTKE